MTAAPLPRRPLVAAVTAVLAAVAVWAAVLFAAVRPGTDPAGRISPGTRVGAVGDLAGVVQDEGNTVPLPDGRTLWLFADTARQGPRPFFVTSSAAVSEPGSLTLRYAVRGDGVPVEFLPRTEDERAEQGRLGAGRYVSVWPTGAVRLPDGRIVITYTKYLVNGDPLEFRFLGAGLYDYEYDGDLGDRTARRIADDVWTEEDGTISSPVVADGHLYLIACHDGDFECHSLRAPLDRITDPGAYTWWTGEGWSADRDARRPMVFGRDVPGKDPSMHWVPALGVYAMVDSSGGIPAASGRVWVARHPQGPWSAPGRFPLPGCSRERWCYTLNLHAGMSGPGRIRVTWATGAGIGPYVRAVDVPVRLGLAATSVHAGP